MSKVLCVDDSRVIHSLLTDYLTAGGHQITHAMNGAEAVELLVGDKKTEFDIVFLDWEMPIMTGPEALEKVKAAGLKTPVVMLTTKNSMDDIASMLEKGAAEYVMKPFTQGLILEKLESVLGLQAA